MSSTRYTSEELLQVALSSDIAMPGKIMHTHAGGDFFVVEDITGQPVAISPSLRMARLIFAAPGLLNTLESIATALEKFGRNGGHMEPEIVESLLQALKDASSALEGAARVQIEEI